MENEATTSVIVACYYTNRVLFPFLFLVFFLLLVNDTFPFY